MEVMNLDDICNIISLLLELSGVVQERNDAHFPLLLSTQFHLFRISGTFYALKHPETNRFSLLEMIFPSSPHRCKEGKPCIRFKSRGHHIVTGNHLKKDTGRDHHFELTIHGNHPPCREVPIKKAQRRISRGMTHNRRSQ
jgi:hypothetical protein